MIYLIRFMAIQIMCTFLREKYQKRRGIAISPGPLKTLSGKVGSLAICGFIVTRVFY